MTGLDADTEYTFEVRAKNGIGYSTESAVTRTTPDPAWSFTLRDSSNTNVTQLVEGGDVRPRPRWSITNNVRFSTAQTVTLKWGVNDIGPGSLIQGAGGATTITIPAEGTSGSLEVSVPNESVEVYYLPLTTALTATHGGTVIGSIDLTRRMPTTRRWRASRRRRPR